MGQWLSMPSKMSPALLAYKKAWAEANADKVKETLRRYNAKNKEVVTSRIKAWRDNNPEKMQAARDKWASENKGRLAARVRTRQASKIKRTPKWLTENDKWMIREAYDLAVLRTELFGFSWHVDHIIPLQGKLVSGLHVPTNLQVIPAHMNCKKGNKHELH